MLVQFVSCQELGIRLNTESIQGAVTQTFFRFVQIPGMTIEASGRTVQNLPIFPWPSLWATLYSNVFGVVG